MNNAKLNTWMNCIWYRVWDHLIPLTEDIDIEYFTFWNRDSYENQRKDTWNPMPSMYRDISRLNESTQQSWFALECLSTWAEGKEILSFLKLANSDERRNVKKKQWQRVFGGSSWAEQAATASVYQSQIIRAKICKIDLSGLRPHPIHYNSY